MFYEIYVNIKKELLIFRMKILTRILSTIFFISLMAMLIFNLSVSEIFEFYFFQIIFLIIIIFLSFLGTFYLDEIRFSKKRNKIIIKKGLLFLFKKYEYSFDDFEAVIFRKTLKMPNPLAFQFSEKYFYMFGLKIKDKTLIIENRLTEEKFNEFLNIFKTFFPGQVELKSV